MAFNCTNHFVRAGIRFDSAASNFLRDLSFKVISGIQIAIKWLSYQISLESATKWLIRWAILYKGGEGGSLARTTRAKRKAQCASTTRTDFRVTRIMGRFPDLESP